MRSGIKRPVFENSPLNSLHHYSVAVDVVVCPPHSPFRSGPFSPSCQGSCQWMGSQCVPAQELPWAEGILNPSAQRQPSLNARVQRLGLLIFCFILRHL